MKCDDSLVSREAVICMKRPQKELVGHLLDSCMQAHQFLTQPVIVLMLIKCLLNEQVGFWKAKIKGVMSQLVWGPRAT